MVSDNTIEENAMINLSDQYFLILLGSPGM
jgi:hypothetical protein